MLTLLPGISVSDVASVVTILSVLRDPFVKVTTQKRSELEVELKTNQKSLMSIPHLFSMTKSRKEVTGCNLCLLH